jgi:hypothetical protein
VDGGRLAKSRSNFQTDFNELLFILIALKLIDILSARETPPQPSLIMEAITFVALPAGFWSAARAHTRTRAAHKFLY